jgi:bacteriorhodopsin
MNEFSIYLGNAGKGIVSSVLAASKYILAPIFVLTALATFLSQMEGASMITGQIDLARLKDNVLVLGTLIALLAFFRGFYPRGSLSRCVFGVAVSLLVCIWIWVIAMGGNMTLTMEEASFSISYLGFVLLFILAAALRGAFFAAEMLSYRKEWLASLEPQAVPAGSETA